MKTLIFGAGPIGCIYAYLLHKAGLDVTILARNKTYEYIKEHGLVMTNEFTGETNRADVKVVDRLEPDDRYDLVAVAVRKNKISSILPVLANNKNIKHILFIGNNAVGFDEYVSQLPESKLLFGFGSAGGSRKEHVIHYIDSEKPGGKRMSLKIGEMDGRVRERTKQIEAMFQEAGIPVEVVTDIDGWLKYHIAMVFPLCAAMLKHDCDNYELAKSKEDVRDVMRAIKEAGNVLATLGYAKPLEFRFKVDWMPEFLVVWIFRKVLSTKFAEVAIAMHAKAAADEFKMHTEDFMTLAQTKGVKTPYIDKLKAYF